ncbi:MAG: 50S ribosomal protein L15e [Candidatus Thermoplasmatota archaeon]|nr:50S ribosomal protein L15e [Candidatus Thermoplasmatota archaeon]
MTKGLYQHLRETWKKPDASYQSSQWKRLIEWRKEGSIVRIENPTRIDRAHALGYKAKQGFIVVRAKVRKGGLRKQRPSAGRKPSRMGINKITPGKSTQRIAEERVAKHYPNMEVLNSYKVGADGKHHYYEVILVDRSHPAITNDKDVNWVAEEKNRVYRGKTSAGKKGRGLENKWKGAEKVRPSIRANKRRGK